MSIQNLHTLFLSCSGIATDTRKIQKGSLFFALKGERFDANTLVPEALKKGAKYAVIDNREYAVEGKTILVENTLDTLQKLASYHREYLNIPILSLTGSNGKTTTKELIAAVLSEKYNIKATQGNLNNHIGVPLTLLSFDSTTEIGIVEMGANHQQEIAFLCTLAKPDYGYITNFGKAHLEGFGGVEGVIKGKSELYDYLIANDKTAFINLDDPIQESKTSSIARISFSLHNPEATYLFSTLTQAGALKVVYDKTPVSSQLIGDYNTPNIMAAISIGLHFGVPFPAIKEAIENYQPTNNRSQQLIQNNNVITLDAYNANPSSMQAALQHFFATPAPHQVVILGDMFELGADADAEHRSIISRVISENTTAYFVGKHFYANRTDHPKTWFFEDFDTLANHFKTLSLHNAHILIKGSRGMALERLLPYL